MYFFLHNLQKRVKCTWRENRKGIEKVTFRTQRIDVTPLKRTSVYVLNVKKVRGEKILVTLPHSTVVTCHTLGVLS